MHRLHMNSTKRFTRNFLYACKSSIFYTIFLSQLFIVNEQWFVQSMMHSSTHDNFGAYMVKQPESIIAPLYDEVQFECELNLLPDRMEWRFRPERPTLSGSFHSNDNDRDSDYIYLDSVSFFFLLT